MPEIGGDTASSGGSRASNHRAPRRNLRWKEPATPEPAPSSYSTPSTTPAPSTPSRSGAHRFDQANLTKLTPYAMPVEGNPLASWAAEGVPGAEKKKKPLDVPDLFAKDDPYRMKRDEVMADDRQQAEHRGKPVVKRTYEMSWEDYNKLSPEQKAAVDFNTMLVQAREKDLNTDYQETPEQKATYEKAVAHMFGKDGGSETYAPETLAVLRQVDFNPNAGDDLDNYLGLKHAISAKELKNFNLDPQQVSIDVPSPMAAVTGDSKIEGKVLGTEQQLAAGTAAMQKTLAKGNQLMRDFQKSAALARNADLQFFGGEANKGVPEFGFGQQRARADKQGIDDFFRVAFDKLAQKENDGNLDSIWGQINGTLRPNEVQAFMQYADERSRQAADYGLDLGSANGVKYRSPDEFRQILGLDKAGG